MSEQNTSKTNHETAPETAPTPDGAPPAAPSDKALNDTDLDNVAGGFAPAPARKAGKPQMEYMDYR